MKRNIPFILIFLGLLLPAALWGQPGPGGDEGVYTDLKLALENKAAVKHLNLSGQKLKKFPKEILELYNLESLDLSKNKLEKLPDDIGKLKKLTVLNLSNNKIEELPAGIGDLKRLMSLNLYHNAVWKLPNELGQLTKLEYLYLNGNPIFRLPETMKACSSLKFLDLRRTEFSEGDKNALREMFPGVDIYFDSGCTCGPNN